MKTGEVGQRKMIRKQIIIQFWYLENWKIVLGKEIGKYMEQYGKLHYEHNFQNCYI